jgi:diaminohydroxyphosphoribosylaminopyrimidine deaminase/5-amino-6-(5-phosphoribosylamino)uracil reductase
MRTAVALGRRALGRAWPNPAVGCVLVRGGRVVGRGWTQPGGRPHAETEALRQAGESARGASAYVTLEPCNHEGVTGPCSAALIGAGIARVVIAAEDPDPRVRGGGVARLRRAGLAVTIGVCSEDAAELNLGFFLRVTEGRPMVTLKLASSLDGRIATQSGDSRWITGEQARAEGHRLRANHDAVLVGSATVLADDPALTCRLPGMSDRSPVRVIADGRLRLPGAAQLVRTAHRYPTWVMTGGRADADRRVGLCEAGVDVIEVAAGPDGRLDPGAILRALASRGLTRVLLEGGGELAASFLAAGLVDRVAWFHAPRIIGAEGRPATGSLAAKMIADTPAFRLRAITEMGEDVLALYSKRS